VLGVDVKLLNARRSGLQRGFLLWERTVLRYCREGKQAPSITGKPSNHVLISSTFATRRKLRIPPGRTRGRRKGEGYGPPNNEGKATRTETWQASKKRDFASIKKHGLLKLQEESPLAKYTPGREQGGRIENKRAGKNLIS